MRRLNLKRASSGFTLIELIITIVIIGILAAVAIPKFISLSSDAEKGVSGGAAGSLASALSVNYAKSKAPGATAGTDYKAIAGCADVQTNLAALAEVPTGYAVVGTATAGAAAGSAVTGCSVQKGTDAATATPFNIIVTTTSTAT